MIVFDLSCDGGHRFEGWFGSSNDFSSQSERGLLICPECGSAGIVKAPMAPAVAAKGNSSANIRRDGEQGKQSDLQEAGNNTAPSVSNTANASLPETMMKVVKKIADIQAAALKNSKWVGKDFAEKSRAMHYGEEKPAAIHGEATPEQAQDLRDEGVSVSPLPLPVAPPKDVN
ncbi:DUF1178 family protein [Pontixanthobacter sp.]|uniref:DUF1178 family protein n=1 Tax=Pontixanthobacter sp. TaxID=2792078 RepID=UPI003C7E08BB